MYVQAFGKRVRINRALVDASRCVTRAGTRCVLRSFIVGMPETSSVLRYNSSCPTDLRDRFTTTPCSRICVFYAELILWYEFFFQNEILKRQRATPADSSHCIPVTWFRHNNTTNIVQYSSLINSLNNLNEPNLNVIMFLIYIAIQLFIINYVYIYYYIIILLLRFW